MVIENTYIYEIKSIGFSTRNGRKPQSLLVAARHNLREIQAENGADFGTIDPMRMHLNEVLIGPKSAREVLSKSNKLYVEAGVDQSKLRKDYNQASEHVFSLRPGQCEGEFFQVIAECSKRIFGEDKVLSFVVHRDQEQPHAHMLVSPISAGEYHGSKLQDHKQLKRYKSEYQRCAETIGFKPVPEGKFARKKLNEMVAAIVSYFEHVNDPLLFHPLWPTILDMIVKDPWSMYQRLNLSNITVPKTMSQARLIGGHASIERNRIDGKSYSTYQNLPCVGFGSAVTSIEAENLAQSAVGCEQVIVVREKDLRPEDYNFETGEYMQSRHVIRHGKSDADMWVSSALSHLRSGKNRN